jgi:glycosyltransferase involved in cell wall biosynthesis
MRFHIPGYVHLPVSEKYSACAFTQKVVKLDKMLRSLGHTTILYGCEGSDDLGTEFVQTHTLRDIQQTWGDGDNRIPDLKYDWRGGMFRHDFNAARTPLTKKFYSTCIEEINKRKQPDDFLLVMQGYYHKPIGDAVKLWLTCEPGVGYRGSYTRFKAFESAYLMNFTYGSSHPGRSINGNYYDRVIPNYFDPKDFPFCEEKGDYYLFIGRVIRRKGVWTAIEATRAIGAKLLIAGQADPEIDITKLPEHCQFIGYVEPEDRARLMGHAKAVFVPTQYLEAFGGVNVEAQLCLAEGVQVESYDAFRGYERLYSGEMLRISTEYGSIECTPEHPFFTSNGWCIAGKLTNKHQLLHNKDYETRKVHSRRIEDIVGELRENRNHSNSQVVGSQDAICSFKGLQIEDHKNMGGKAQDAPLDTYERGISLFGWVHRWRWLSKLPEKRKQEEPETRDTLMQHVRGVHRLVQGSLLAEQLSSPKWDISIHERLRLRIFRWLEEINVHFYDYWSHELPPLQGAFALPCYQETADGVISRVDRTTFDKNQTPTDGLSPTGIRDDDAVYEFAAIEDIRSRSVKGLPVYNLGTCTGIYAANGYLAHNCGTPAISTNFGCFPETIKHGVTGFLCNTLQDFVDAAKRAPELDPVEIRLHASRYFMDNVRHEYQRWFDDLYQLYRSAHFSEKGWSYLKPRLGEVV